MKAIAFTLDAIFALVIASAAISILLYFQYMPQGSYVIGSGDAEGLLSLLLTTNVSALSPSSTVAAAMANQQSGSLEGWDDLRSQAQGQASSPYGPLSPFVSNIFVANSAITTGMVADYGDIYFGASNVLYAVNASGRVSWTNSSSSAVIRTTPALYSGTVFYWAGSSSSGNVVALSANNGTLEWKTALSLGLPSTAPIVASGELILAGTNGDVYILYANNGTVASSNALPGSETAHSVALAGGSIAVMTQNNLNLLTNLPGDSQQGLLWASNALIGTTTGIAASGNVIAFGNGDTASVYYINSTRLGFLTTSYQMAGVAASGNILAFQSASAVTGLSSLTGAELWSSLPFSSSIYGTALTGSAPVIAQSTVYSLWSSGYLVAQNLSTGATEWFTQIPYSPIDPNMTVAYGRLYVAAGNTLLAYGSCNYDDASSPVLQAAASLYLNGEGSCADSLLYSAAPISNYTLAKGSNTISGLSLASFGGAGSYIISGGNYTTLTSFSISLWVYPTARTGSQEDALDSIPSHDWMIGINPSNYLIMDPGSGTTATTSNTIPLDKWSFITMTAYVSGSSTYYTAYLDGSKVLAGSVAQPIANIKRLMFSNVTYPYNGMLADVQLYSSALDGEQVGALYSEGLQGGPLANAGLLSWYPLDGDANDYGSQSNAAYGVNVAYVNANYVPSGLLNAYEVSKASTVLPLQSYTTGVPGLYDIGVEAWGGS